MALVSSGPLTHVLFILDTENTKVQGYSCFKSALGVSLFNFEHECLNIIIKQWIML